MIHPSPPPPPPQTPWEGRAPGVLLIFLCKVHTGEALRATLPREELPTHRVPLALPREGIRQRWGEGSFSPTRHSRFLVTPVWAAEDRRCQPDSHHKATDFRKLNYTDGFSEF